jgi:hypothetical protein
MPRGGSKPGERRGGRKKGTPNKLTAKLQAPLAKAAQQYDGNALQTLVAIMNDDTATTAARVRCAELILERAHGKPAYLQDPYRDPGFVPLAERLKWYARQDAIEAAEGKVAQILPPKTVRPVELPSSAMPRATTIEDDPFGP